MSSEITQNAGKSPADVLNKHLELKPVFSLAVSALKDKGFILDFSTPYSISDLCFIRLMVDERLMKMYEDLKVKPQAAQLSDLEAQ